MATVRKFDWDGSFYDRDDANGNVASLVAKGQNALTSNATFLALGSPTNAQTLAQVQSLTRQMNALIRLTLGQFDTTNGT
jgi:hypothetical protein